MNKEQLQADLQNLCDSMEKKCIVEDHFNDLIPSLINNDDPDLDEYAQHLDKWRTKK